MSLCVPSDSIASSYLVSLHICLSCFSFCSSSVHYCLVFHWAENGLKWMRSGRAVSTAIIWLLPARLKAEDALPTATLCFAFSRESQAREKIEKLICAAEQTDGQRSCGGLIGNTNSMWLKKIAFQMKQRSLRLQKTKTQRLINGEMISDRPVLRWLLCLLMCVVTDFSRQRGFFNTCWDIREIMWDGVDLIQQQHHQCTLRGSGIFPPLPRKNLVDDF